MPIVVRHNTKKYIAFDDNGNILSISNKPNTDQYIEVETTEVQDIVKGIIPAHEYKVEYDLVEKQYTLKHANYWKEARTSDSFLYKITTAEDPDITLVQNNAKQCWELKLHQDILDNISIHKISIKNIISGFSITDKNNPYNLHYILNFDEDKLVQEYPENFKIDSKEVSVYTVKKLGSYSHEVINE